MIVFQIRNQTYEVRTTIVCDESKERETHLLRALNKYRTINGIISQRIEFRPVEIEIIVVMIVNNVFRRM